MQIFQFFVAFFRKDQILRFSLYSEKVESNAYLLKLFDTIKQQQLQSLLINKLSSNEKHRFQKIS